MLVPSDVGVKTFRALVAAGRPLVKSGCGLRFGAARPMTIDLPCNDPQINRRAVGQSGFYRPRVNGWDFPLKKIQESSRHRQPFLSLPFCCVAFDNHDFWAIWLIMANEQDAILSGRLSEAQSVSIPQAARLLGLDAYTLCTLIQRERVQAEFSPSGEFVISKSEMERLAGKAVC